MLGTHSIYSDKINGNSVMLLCPQPYLNFSWRFFLKISVFMPFREDFSVPHKCLSWAKAPGGTENSESLGREDEDISFLFSMGQYFTESPMK